MYVTSLMAQKHFLNIKIVFVYNTLHYIGQTHLRNEFVKRKICYIIIKSMVISFLHFFMQLSLKNNISYKEEAITVLYV